MKNVFVGEEASVARTWLVDLLHGGEVSVTFIKKDGTHRTMLCTLKEGSFTPYEKKTDKEKHRSDETLSVWDIEKSAWRSFRWDSIHSVNIDV